MNNEELTKRAVRAEQILRDPMIVEAFGAIEKEIIDQWELCPVRDTEGRELLWQYYKVTRKFKGIFEGAVQNGKVAAFREQQSAADKMVNIFKGRKNA